MKACLPLVIIFGSFFSCSKTVDNTNLNCTSDCTTIRGKIFTRDNKPIPSINIVLSYTNPRLYSSDTRKIKSVKSDENGYYEMDFHANDNEVGAAGKGYFTIDLDKNSFDINHFLVYSDPLFAISTQIYSLSKRDTTIIKDFYMPTRSSVKIHLEDFKPIKAGDLFQVEVLYPYGWRMDVRNNYLGGDIETGSGGDGGQYAATSSNYTTTIGVALSDTCVIRIGKIRNGISLPEEVRTFVHDNSLPEYTFHY